MGRGVSQIPNEDPDRLGRVLDAKWRTIGVDKSALDAQVAERKAREAAERERDGQYAQLAQHFDDQVVLQQQEADHLRGNWNRKVDGFRATQQGKATTREWDLNRPDAKKIDQPAREGDDDPRLGPSSLQKFEGEDLSAGARQAEQMGQCKAWWEEQRAQLAAMKAAEAEAEAAHAELIRYHDWLQNNSAAVEQGTRRDVAKAHEEFNRTFADFKAEEAARRAQEELNSNFAELDLTLNSAFMTEDPLQATSAMSAYRVRKDHYKGMTDTERRAIFATQLAQMQDNKARREAERVQEALYARTQLEIGRALEGHAQRADDFRRKQAQKVAELNKMLNQEKNTRDMTTKDLYGNKIAPEYFQQFGTSHR